MTAAAMHLPGMNPDEPAGIDPDETGGKVSAVHPETSHRAARLVRSGTQKAALLAIVCQSRYGVTCAEAAPRLSTAVGHVVSRNQTATRMLELREAEFVTARREHGQVVERRTEGASTAVVWVATAAGVAAWAGLRG